MMINFPFRNIFAVIVMTSWVILSSSRTGSLVQASAGDSDWQYQDRLRQCISKSCQLNSEQQEEDSVISFVTGQIKWSCQAECKYEVMHEITQTRLQNDQPILQYYGKWPFVRLFGLMQEPASVLFSIMNFYAQYRIMTVFLEGSVSFLQQASRGEKGALRNKVGQIPYPLRLDIILVCLTQLNAWIWSIVFHCRDLWWSERLDYFGAMLALVSSLYFALHRVFFLDISTSQHSAFKRVIWMVLRFALVGFYCAHVWYLGSLQRFDYTYNMTASVIVGMLHNFVWLWFGMTNLFMKKVHGWPASTNTSLYIIASVLGVTAALSLELFDFPPIWFVFDAHSLWHFATFVLAWSVWRQFLLSDYQDFLVSAGTHSVKRPLIRTDYRSIVHAKDF